MLRLLLALAAAAATAAPGATDAEAKREAEHARLGSVIEPAELEAVPPGSRAVLEQLLDQVVTLRGEVGSLKAGKLASDARAARLSERVDGLEIMCADHDTQHAAEAPQREAPQPRENATTSTEPRRRTQASQACARGQDFQVLTAAAMDACCPSGGGHHRRSLQASCSLPATCPSAACAAVFVPFMADCDAMLSTMPGSMLTQFQSFAASCSELQAGAGKCCSRWRCRCSACWSPRRARRRPAACFPGAVILPKAVVGTASRLIRCSLSLQHRRRSSSTAARARLRLPVHNTAWEGRPAIQTRSRAKSPPALQEL